MIANDGTLIGVVRPTKQQYPIREMTLTDVFLQPKETEAEDGNLSLDLIQYIVWASLQKFQRLGSRPVKDACKPHKEKTCFMQYV